jgi:hypothetical protein
MGRLIKLKGKKRKFKPLKASMGLAKTALGLVVITSLIPSLRSN